MRSLWIFILCSLLLASCAEPTPEAIIASTPASSHTPRPTIEHLPTSTITATLTPSPEPKCEPESGLIEETGYPGVLVEFEVPVRVYLPPCYETSGDRYPVLYLLHGYPMDELHWDDLGVVQVVEEGIASNQWGPFLMVMPKIPDPLNTQSDGGPGSYEEEMLSGLIPFVEGNYRTIGSKRFHALAGVSRGGVWALEIGLRNFDWFDSIAALSPALHVNRARPAYDPFNLIRTSKEFPTNIFLSAAESEGGFRTKTEELSQLMEAFEIQHTYLLTPGVHEDATWKAIMLDFVSFIVSSWGIDEN